MDFRGSLSRLAGGVILAIVLSALPAQAHSTAELDTWLEEWRATLVEAERFRISGQHFAEYFDMAERHPWHFSHASVSEPPSSSGARSNVNRGMGSDVEQWRNLVATHFAPELVETALCVMAHESGGNPNAKNPISTAAGLFQFLQSTWDQMVPDSVAGGSYASGAPYDPEKSVRSAAWLQAAEGWSQWNAYRYCG
jgi:hypothetical protein